jgi:hypothetical protein
MRSQDGTSASQRRRNTSGTSVGSQSPARREAERQALLCGFFDRGVQNPHLARVLRRLKAESGKAVGSRSEIVPDGRK